MSRRAWILVALVVALLLVGGGIYVAGRKLGETEASRLQTLQSRVRLAFEAGRAELSAVHGIELVVVSTRRNQDQQNAKIEAGQSATKNSWHLLDRAVDVQTARKIAGKYIPDPDAKDLDSYRKLHAVMKRHGFQGTPNGAAFNADGSVRTFKNASGKTISDVGHLEFTDGLTFAAAQKRDAATGVA